MSTYNLMYGMNPMTLFIVPMLFEKHPDELPRFRDSFVRKEDDVLIILILSRTGKHIRDEYDTEIFTEHPEFTGIEEKLITKDFIDNTYAWYRFNVPEKWQEDFKKIIMGNAHDVSDDLKDLVKRIFPKLKNELKIVFNENEE